MRTLILCGGKGTRAYPHTLEVPKALLTVGDRPVLSHLLEVFATQGFHEFVLAGGYKVELLERFSEDLSCSWDIQVVDTGLDTNTGERLWRCQDLLGPTFFVTYADGLGNVDLGRLAAFHANHPGAATLTTVPLPSPYGTIELSSEGRVERFREKPALPDHLINAGFFVFDQRAFEHWSGDDLERHVLPGLGDAGELYAYRHHGFWKSMDTLKDVLALTELCANGSAPWFRTELGGGQGVGTPLAFP